MLLEQHVKGPVVLYCLRQYYVSEYESLDNFAN